MDAKNETVTEYWWAFYNYGHCSLCGNSGRIDTRGVKTAAGVPVGRLNYCICPNGQALREFNSAPSNANVCGLPPDGHPLRKLGARLAELLDEDHWAECERLLLEGWEHDRIDRKTGAHWRENSSLEIWFPFTAEAIATAYGYLWHVNNEPGTPNQYPPERAAYEARKILRDQMTHEQRGLAINRVRELMGHNAGNERTAD